MKLIGLLGKSCAGKDTAGQMLVGMSPPGDGMTMAFADKLKDIAGEMFGLTRKDMYDNDFKMKPTTYDCLMCPECRSQDVNRFTQDRIEHGQCKVCSTIGDVKVFTSKWTPRTILQYLGTEGFRRIDPNVWVNFLIRSAKEQLERGGRLRAMQASGADVGEDDKGPRFIAVTDCRFKSECEGIWTAGGEVWRIRRPETDDAAVGLKGHASEMELESIPDNQCQAVIMNTGSLDALGGRLRTELHRFLR